MQRVLGHAGGVTVVDAEVPTPMPGEVLVRTVLAGVCGSDTHAIQGRHPFVTPPYAPGHEAVGVEERTGRRVVLEPFLPCWSCKQCRAGRQNLCEHLRFFGCGHPQGAMASFFTVDARRLHTIPDELDWTQAALIEPLGTPVHAIRLAGGVAGRTVAILGAGTIGLLTLQVARSYGAKRIVMTARTASHRRRALDFGADAALAPDGDLREALGESADVVFDCVASQSTMDSALSVAAKAGSVVVVGVPPADVRVPLPVIQDSQLRIQGSATYLPEDFAEAMRLLAGGMVTAGDFVTAVHPLGDAAAAFADAAGGDHVKVLLSNVRTP